MDVDSVTGAMRRRQRRLRQFLRHERLSVAMALAEKLHHTSRSQRFARAGGEGVRREKGPRSTTRHDDRSPLLPRRSSGCSMRKTPELGARPGSVTDPVPHGRVERHTVEHRLSFLCRKWGIRSRRLSWSLCRVSPCPRSPRTASHSVLRFVVLLVEVATEPGWLSLPRCSNRGVRFVVFSQNWVQQRPVQRSSLILQFLRVGGGEGGRWRRSSRFSSQTESSSRGRGADRRPGSLSGQGSTASSSRRLHDDADEGIQGVFSHSLPFFKKSAGMGPHSGSELPRESSSSSRRAHAVPMVPEDNESVTESESEVEQDCDPGKEDAGHRWIRTAAFPGRVVLAWYWLRRVDLVGRARLGFLESDVGQPLAFSGFFACRCATDRCPGGTD